MRKTALILFAFLSAVMANAQNPYLPLWEHIPDGEPRVFEDPDNPGKYRAYIIGSHDVAFTQYCGPDVRIWSAPVEDLSKWVDEGSAFKWYVNGRWDTMYAPDLVEVKDKTGKKTYYLYPHSRGAGRIATVCKSDRPDGPFIPINVTPDGVGVLEGSLIDFDPSVYIEEITDKKDTDYNNKPSITKPAVEPTQTYVSASPDFDPSKKKPMSFNNFKHKHNNKKKNNNNNKK